MRLFLLILVILFSCSKPTIVSSEFAGIITDANQVPTAFNECLKMQVKTTKMVVILRDQPAVLLGDSAFVVTLSNGFKYFTWKNSRRCYQTQGTL